ncbi:MAG: hypothetical protein ACJ8GW_00635 [Massilia sp.]
MENPGPFLEILTHRLTDTPSEFLAEPRIGDGGEVHVAALVNDVLMRLGARAPAAFLQQLKGRDAKRDRNRLALCMIAAWLLADAWFVTHVPEQTEVLALFTDALAELAKVTPAHKFVNDPDRREELARIVLARLGYRPAGETPAQASDRLSSISGTERRHLLELSRAAEARARDIRAALAQKAAEESADKWTRE